MKEKGERQRGKGEESQRGGVSDKASETRGGVCDGESKRFCKEGGRKRGRKDADVEASQRKHDDDDEQAEGERKERKTSGEGV